MRTRWGRARTWCQGDAGAQMVEFALVLPVLLLIVLGIINFGYLFGQKLALNQAVREGARMAVVPGTTDVQTLVGKSTGGLIPAGEVTVELPKGGCKSVGQQLQVDAAYRADLLVPMPIPGFPEFFDLKGSAVFRCEWIW